MSGRRCMGRRDWWRQIGRREKVEVVERQIGHGATFLHHTADPKNTPCQHCRQSEMLSVSFGDIKRPQLPQSSAVGPREQITLQHPEGSLHTKHVLWNCPVLWRLEGAAELTNTYAYTCIHN